MDTLPAELLAYIFNRLMKVDLYAVSAVCKAWRQCVDPSKMLYFDCAQYLTSPVNTFLYQKDSTAVKLTPIRPIISKLVGLRSIRCTIAMMEVMHGTTEPNILTWMCQAATRAAFGLEFVLQVAKRVEEMDKVKYGKPSDMSIALFVEAVAAGHASTRDALCRLHVALGAFPVTVHFGNFLRGKMMVYEDEEKAAAAMRDLRAFLQEDVTYFN